MKSKLLFSIIFFSFQFNYSMDLNALHTMLANDDIDSLIKAINDGFNINSINENGVPILLNALLTPAEKIAQALILRGANLNIYLQRRDETKKISLLFIALSLNSVSIETVKLLLNYGADINFVYEIKRKHYLRNQKIKKTLFHCLDSNEIEISDVKKQFIIDYLKNYYGKDLLIVALNKCDNYNVIEELVINDAIIPPNIIEIATKLKVNKKTFDFLKRQLNINETIVKSAQCLPYEIAHLINQYSRGQEQSLDDSLAEAIISKDIHFIKNYIRGGGNPNYTFELKDSRWPLLLFAINTGAEQIANFLIDSGAGVNIQCRCENIYFSALIMALDNVDISLQLVKKILDKKADINFIGTIKSRFNNQSFNLASLLTATKLSAQKWDFIYRYLLQRFGHNVLDFVLEGKTTLSIIKAYIRDGAKVTKHTVETAKKYNHMQEIIEYLDGILHLNEQLEFNNIRLPGYPLTIINDYHCIKEPGNSEKCLVC